MRPDARAGAARAGAARRAEVRATAGAHLGVLAIAVAGAAAGGSGRSAGFAAGQTSARTAPSTPARPPVRPSAACPDWIASRSAAINDSGLVVGSLRARDGTQHAALWVLARAPGGRDSLLDLGVPAGADRSDAAGVNAAGVVVGTAWRAADDGLGRAAGGTSAAAPDPGAHAAFTWRAGRFAALAGLPAGRASNAAAIDGAGRVAGWVGGTQERATGFVWTPPNRVTYLPAPAGVSLYPRALNDAGVVVGERWRGPADNPTSLGAFVWRPGGTGAWARPRPLFAAPTRPDAPGVVYAEAEGLNAAGAVVGALTLNTPQAGPRPFALAGGRGGLPRVGDPAALDTSVVDPEGMRGRFRAVNARGARAGTFEVGRAVLSVPGRPVRILPPAPGFREAEAVALDSRGTVAGFAGGPVGAGPDTFGVTRAVVWGPDGAVRLLPLTPAGCAAGSAPAGR